MESLWMALEVYISRQDNERIYKIVNKSPTEFYPEFILIFCTTFICPAKSESEKRGWWEDHYRFEQVDKRTFKYIVTTGNSNG